MSELRVAKASELIKQEMSQMLLYEVKDPRIGFVTITDVTMTRDLREATVYVSIMGKDKEI
ncbi:MAG: ribosome-binding factor A, partial [Selenomonadaceae bacterium]|nr:ribosome-binding factor A [Selenomonadaceae bacterium]